MRKEIMKKTPKDRRQERNRGMKNSGRGVKIEIRIVR